MRTNSAVDTSRPPTGGGHTTESPGSWSSPISVYRSRLTAPPLQLLRMRVGQAVPFGEMAASFENDAAASKLTAGAAARSKSSPIRKRRSGFRMPRRSTRSRTFTHERKVRQEERAEVLLMRIRRTVARRIVPVCRSPTPGSRRDFSRCPRREAPPALRGRSPHGLGGDQAEGRFRR